MSIGRSAVLSTFSTITPGVTMTGSSSAGMPLKACSPPKNMSPIPCFFTRSVIFWMICGSMRRSSFALTLPMMMTS